MWGKKNFMFNHKFMVRPKEIKITLLPYLLSASLFHAHITVGADATAGTSPKKQLHKLTKVRLVKACHRQLIWLRGVRHRLSSQIWGRGQQEADTSWSCQRRGECPILQDPDSTLPDLVAVSMNFMGLGEETSSANWGRVASARDASKM